MALLDLPTELLERIVPSLPAPPVTFVQLAGAMRDRAALRVTCTQLRDAVPRDALFDFTSLFVPAGRALHEAVARQGVSPMGVLAVRLSLDRTMKQRGVCAAFIRYMLKRAAAAGLRANHAFLFADERDLDAGHDYGFAFQRVCNAKHRRRPLTGMAPYVSYRPQRQVARLTAIWGAA